MKTQTHMMLSLRKPIFFNANVMQNATENKSNLLNSKSF